MKRVPRVKAIARQSLVFGAIGLFNTAIDFAVFFVLLHFLHWTIVVSQLVSYSCGILNSYLCNRYFTFSHRGTPSSREFAKFVMLNVLSYLLSTAVIYLLRQISIPVMIGKLLSLALTVILNFAGSRYWVFRTA